jgi:Phospholipid methyltransferase
VYAFALTPSGSLLGLSVYVAFSLIVLGTLLVLVSMIFLRRAFSVTPQARFLVTSGPYRIVRHPMYVGNILSLLGVAFLVDSWEAVTLFFICAGLQIARAHYDENVLQATFPEYTDYKKRVGGFIPRLGVGAHFTTAVFIFGALCFRAPGDASAMTAFTGMNSLLPSLESPIVRVANTSDEWGPKCEVWSSAVARPGVWLSATLKATIDGAQNNFKSADKCKSFFVLWSKCRSYENDWANKNVGDAAFIKEIEELSGCEAIVGLDNVCVALEKLAYGGTVLSPPQLAVITECFVVDLKKNPILLTAIRPAM